MCFCSNVLGMRGLDRQGSLWHTGESKVPYLSNFTTPYEFMIVIKSDLWLQMMEKYDRGCNILNVEYCSQYL